MKPVHFDVNLNKHQRYDFLRHLKSIDCDKILNYYNKNDLIKMSDFNAYDYNNVSEKQLCEDLSNLAPHPAINLQKNLQNEDILFETNPAFFYFDYHPNSSSSALASHKGSKSNIKKTTQKDSKAWKTALGNFDDEDKWIERVYQQLEILNETPTGNMILKLVATLWQPGEITITNENATRLSANIMTNTLNIPSVPRFICYNGPNNSLINSQLWMALGHELIHLIHERFNIHYHSDPNSEEENTVQGIVNEYDNIDYSLYDINGVDWKLTENAFRNEHQIPIRNGYDSMAVCSSFESHGCDVFNQYGDETCQVLEKSKDPGIKKVYNDLKNKSKHNKK